ncbi:MAG: hypothetical protein K6F83_08615 [Clostridiales bacterium]|nr:hypothetical protein [Clostridiales bacterium]
MENSEKRTALQQRIESVELRKESLYRYYDEAEDSMRRSLARSEEALNNKYLRPDQLQRFYDLHEEGRKYARALSEEREERQYELKKEMDRYQEELQVLEEEEGRKEKDQNEEFRLY